MNRYLSILLALVLASGAAAQCVPCMHLGGQVTCPSGITPGATSIEFVPGGIRWSDGNISVGTDLMAFAGCPVTPAPVPTTAPGSSRPRDQEPRTAAEQAALTQQVPPGPPGVRPPVDTARDAFDAAANELLAGYIGRELPQDFPRVIETRDGSLPPLDPARQPAPVPGDATGAGTPAPAHGESADAARLRAMSEAVRKRADGYRELAAGAREHAATLQTPELRESRERDAEMYEAEATRLDGIADEFAADAFDQGLRDAEARQPVAVRPSPAPSAAPAPASPAPAPAAPGEEKLPRFGVITPNNPAGRLVQSVIDFLRSHGFAEDADLIQGLLDSGNIRFDVVGREGSPIEAGDLADTRDGVVTLVQSDLAGMIKADPSAPNFLGIVLGLARTLVHEAVHTTQSPDLIDRSNKQAYFGLVKVHEIEGHSHAIAVLSQIADHFGDRVEQLVTSGAPAAARLGALKNFAAALREVVAAIDAVKANNYFNDTARPWDRLKANFERLQKNVDGKISDLEPQEN